MIPSTKDTIKAVEDWVVSVLPEVDGSTYDHATDERYKGLPDVAIEIVEYKVGSSEPVTGSLAQLQSIEQERTKTSQVEIIVVVKPDPPAEAEENLKDFSDRLVNSLLSDTTLGGRVQWSGDEPRVLFRPPYVEFEDGTQGRICTMYVTLGQRLED